MMSAMWGGWVGFRRRRMVRLVDILQSLQGEQVVSEGDRQKSPLVTSEAVEYLTPLNKRRTGLIAAGSASEHRVDDHKYFSAGQVYSVGR